MGKCTTWLYPFTRQAFAQCAYSRHLPFAFSSPCCAVFLPGQFLARLKEARRQIEIPNNGFFLSPSPGTRKNWNSRAWRGTLQAVQQRQIFPANVIKRRSNITSPLRIHLAINKGFGTLTGVNDDILFSATITTLKDSRCVPLYHSIILKRKNNGHQFD